MHIECARLVAGWEIQAGLPVAARIITVVKEFCQWQDGKLGSKAGTEKHLIGQWIISTVQESIHTCTCT